MHNSFIIPIFAKKQQKMTMAHITTKEQDMTWLMRNKKKKEERLETMKAIAIKKYEERTGLKANYVETL